MDSPITMEYIEQCAPGAPAAIVKAIIQTESSFNPLAIHVNKGVKLARQPASRKEAEVWGKWFIENGYNIDAGLMQINSGNWERLGLSTATVFDTCENIRAGATLFSRDHQHAVGSLGPGKSSIIAALSAYNTGNYLAGVRNGYVLRVMKNMNTTEHGESQTPAPMGFSGAILGRPPIERIEKERSIMRLRPLDPFTAETAVEDFRLVDLPVWDPQSNNQGSWYH